MARAWRWLGAARRALARSSCTSATDLDAIRNTTTTIYNPMTVAAAEEGEAEVSMSKNSSHHPREDETVAYRDAFSREDLAVITIQACFRGHLVRELFALCVYVLFGLQWLSSAAAACAPHRAWLSWWWWWAGAASVSGAEEPGEAAGRGAGRVRAAAGADRHPLHAGARAVAGAGAGEAATGWIRGGWLHLW
ncbi:hypothetical protein BHM03_00030863 [Ensete ventricosum]|nr:hypothetical protein BHM03_00030863 [Ensete ventricosum]